MTTTKRLAHLASTTLVLSFLLAALLGLGLRATMPTRTIVSTATHTTALHMRPNGDCDAAPPCD
jgi:hypothetical protein